MSHLGTRLLADRFADSSEGVNSIVQEVPLHGSDPLPSETITIYDDTQDGWVARGMAPDEDATVVYPCIRLVTMSVDYSSAVPNANASGAWTVTGTLRIGAQLLLRDVATADQTVAGMYWLRAMRGVVVRLDDPSNETARESCGIRLERCTAVTQGQIDAKLGDTIVSPGALLLTYDIIETVPLPLSLH